MLALHRLVEFEMNNFNILLNSVKPWNLLSLFLKPSLVLYSTEIENELTFNALSSKINVGKELKEIFQSLSLLCSSWI